MTAPIKTALLHYSSPPVVGGVEAVIAAHARAFVAGGYPVDVISGRGDIQALPEGVGFHCIAELDSQNAEIERISAELAAGRVPGDFEGMAGRIAAALAPVLAEYQAVIFHNVLTKHFNLPLTAAIWKLIDENPVWKAIAWCHDLSWTSAHSRQQLHPGYPWDLLRRYDPKVTYVAISAERQKELAGMLGCSVEQIALVYNGVDPTAIDGLSDEGRKIVEAFGLLQSDLNLLMPVRVTQAKNIELACQVVAELKKHIPRVRLVVTGPPDPHDAGSMEYFHSLLALRDELGLGSELRFVYELDQGLKIGEETVDGLYRLADLVFIPSHREGFGMPVLEAGLVGLPVFSTPIPASLEIGGDSIHLFEADDTPATVAEGIRTWAETDPTLALKRRVRQSFTWQAIFEQKIVPLIANGKRN